MIRLRPSGADEVLIKRVRDWYEPGPGVFIEPQSLFSPAMLFTGSTTGAWYDPSDTTTLFRDAAGTLPVTAVEQPVGLMLDKSGRGNHAFNSSGNSANFPVLSARVNLLTKTEDFSDAVWSKNQATAPVVSVTNPIGGVSANKLISAASTNWHFVYQNAIPANSTVKALIYAKAAEETKLCFSNLPGNAGVTFDLTAVTASVSGTDAGFIPSSPTITSVGNGWFLCAATIAVTTATQLGVYVRQFSTSFAGDGTSGIYIWGADLRVSNDALNQPAYQRVNTSTDYDTVGFKPYLRFNGTNQWLQTNSIDFTYGDKMFVSAGVRKLSDAAVGLPVELGSGGSNNSFYVGAPGAAGPASDQFQSKGITGATAIYATSGVPITRVYSGIGEISTDTSILRINGSQAAISTADQGTGNYGNYPMYIGARGGSSLWFNGRLYQMVVAGKQASAAEITSTETYLNQKTGAF